MPVADHHLGQAPLPPDVQAYRQQGGVFNATIFQGRALLRPRFPARLARAADTTDAWVRGGRRIAAHLAYRPDRSLAAAQARRPPRRPAPGDQISSDVPAVGSCLRPVGDLNPVFGTPPEPLFA
jgi:hypothetical protein